MSKHWRVKFVIPSVQQLKFDRNRVMQQEDEAQMNSWKRKKNQGSVIVKVEASAGLK